MSAGYRDELEAAHAANESLRSENKELNEQLIQAQNTINQQHQMLRNGSVQLPQPSGVRPVLIVSIALGMMVALAAAGAVFFSLKSSASPPIEPASLSVAPGDPLPRVEPAAQAVPPVEPRASAVEFAPSAPPVIPVQQAPQAH